MKFEIGDYVEFYPMGVSKNHSSQKGVGIIKYLESSHVGKNFRVKMFGEFRTCNFLILDVSDSSIMNPRKLNESEVLQVLLEESV